jgi:hypothetical protein
MQDVLGRGEDACRSLGASACQRKLVGEASSFARFIRSKAGRFTYMDCATSQGTPPRHRLRSDPKSICR